MLQMRGNLIESYDKRFHVASEENASKRREEANDRSQAEVERQMNNPAQSRSEVGVMFSRDQEFDFAKRGPGVRSLQSQDVSYRP